ncbi:ATP-binding protein [Streptomyces sp. ODS05-4]|uniref:ATP-binding protein n=1 Tax=Streptomyces sp. ODS05-4 TaxID=2944939 RepID=UPI002109A8B9|nr:ATP-binding protein [Streptomyces sp. ODS05-4]
MAGLEGMDREPRQRGGTAAAARTPEAAARAPEGADEETAAALGAYGSPADGEVELPSLPESARIARRLTEHVVQRQWSLGHHVAEHAVLLVSELVGNAVRHTGARVFGLRLHRRRGSIRVEVRDPSRGLPCLLPVRETDVSGRGLFLVDTLADRWGVDLLPRGKTTWFEMRVHDR